MLPIRSTVGGSTIAQKIPTSRSDDETAMQRFRAVRTLQKFAAATHQSNHFNHDRHLNRRDIFKPNRSAVLAEWRQLAA